MNKYRVTLERTQHVDCIFAKGQKRSYTLRMEGNQEEAHAWVQRVDCDFNRPWRILSIEPIPVDSSVSGDA